MINIVVADILCCLLDNQGSFKECHSFDVEGVISLYESSFHSFEDETILDEARDFTSKCLKEYNMNENSGTYTSLIINHALELPLHWRVPRCEAHWFINVYEKKKNMSPILLQFAKMDFNIVQSNFQDELKYASR